MQLLVLLICIIGGSYFTDVANATEGKLATLATQADPVFATLNSSVATALSTLVSISRSLDSSQTEDDPNGNTPITKILQEVLQSAATRVDGVLESFAGMTF
jgi:hypothetical protein